METVHGTPINEFLSQSGIYQYVTMSTLNISVFESALNIYDFMLVFGI